MPISRKEAIRNTMAINDLQICLGFVDNASDSTVKILQDDATRAYIVYVGKRRYWGESLFDALKNAASDQE